VEILLDVKVKMRLILKLLNSQIYNKIIPFFIKCPIMGIKYKDFEDFCKVAKLMQNKAHLTEEGLNQIRQIKVEQRKEGNSLIIIYD